MTFRRLATGAALAIAGLAAAVGIGLLANSISGDTVGLGAEPLSAGGSLAPASVQKAEQRQKHRQRQRQRRRRNRGGDETRTTTSGTLTNQIAPAEPGDDNGGTVDNSGSGSSGSSGSGSTPGGSGSTSGGSGSDDSCSSGGSDDSSHSGGSDDD